MFQFCASGTSVYDLAAATAQLAACCDHIRPYIWCGYGITSLCQLEAAPTPLAVHIDAVLRADIAHMPSGMGTCEGSGLHACQRLDGVDFQLQVAEFHGALVRARPLFDPSDFALPLDRKLSVAIFQ